MSEKLCVVMPVYNEQEAIGPVLVKWAKALDALKIDYTIRPYNDGSKDNSLQVMREAAKGLPRVDVKDKLNGGHGNTILTGYREAAAEGYDWIFQIDSDDEMGPEKFGELWENRGKYDFLVGIRDGRVQALPRKIISFVSRCCVKLFYGCKTIWDVNTPYRLMRVSALKDVFAAIPLTTFAPNVIISGMVARKQLRYFETRVPQHDRTTGEVSIKKWKLLKAAAKSFCQTISFSSRFKCGFRWMMTVILIAGALYGVNIVYRAWRSGMKPFDFQYNPVRLMYERVNPYEFSLKSHSDSTVRFDGWMVDANQVPSCLALLLPFAPLSRDSANNVWASCNVVFLFAYLFFMWRSWFRDKKIPVQWFGILCLILVYGSPWRCCISNGQHVMFSLSFFMAAFCFSKEDKWFWGGLCLALSAFKYTTTAPLALIFVYNKWWKQVFVAVGVHILLTIGVAWWLDANPVEMITQSLQIGSYLQGCGTTDLCSLLKQYDILMPQWLVSASYVMFLGLMATVVVWGKKDELLKLSIFAIAGNMMWYHRTYDFPVLVVVMVYVVNSLYKQRTRMSYAIAFITLALTICGFFPVQTIWRIAGPGVIERPIFFSLHLLLLAFLLAENFSVKRQNELT